MELDDDLFSQDQAPARPSRFAPRSKANPKPKSEPAVKREPPKPVPAPEPEELDLKPKREELDALIAKKKEEEEEEGNDVVAKAEDSNGGLKMETDEALNGGDDPMEDDDEDVVVREIDVFFNPKIDDNSQLYVIQYPLRPWWRPYDLENRCQEVRLKPTTSEMQVDLSLDFNPSNYDEDSKPKKTKQTLTTTWKPPLTAGRTSGYAVGVLMGNQLHVNPINAVVQLRPSLDHVPMKSEDSKDSKKKNSTKGDAEESRQQQSLGPSKKQNQQMESSTEEKNEEKESWVPLQYHGSESDLSARYLQKMVVQDSSPIQFSMSPYDYVNSLCPRTGKGSSRRFLISLPLEERIKKLLVEEPVLRLFSDLKEYYVPDHTEEELLDVLEKHAQLLVNSGRWVPKTILLYPTTNDKGEIIQNREYKDRQTARNYILSLFRKNSAIRNSQVEDHPRYKPYIDEFLKILAVSKLSSGKWIFKEQPDESFVKCYPDIVKSQVQNWEMMEEKLARFFNSNTDRFVKNARVTSTLGKSLNPDKVSVKGPSEVPSGGRTMPDETRVALAEAIKEVLQEHKVCNFQLIRKGLSDLALRKSTLPKIDPKSKKVTAAQYGAQAPQQELQKVISQVAVDMHGLYVLQSSPYHPEHDKLRKVVIDLLREKGPNAKLKKGDVFEAAKIALERDINTSEYQKVMNDLCKYQGSAWTLKSGDGSPN